MIAAAFAALAPPDILTAHRMIALGDEAALLPAEADGFSRSVLEVRRRSGAARIAARGLLVMFGAGAVPLPRSPGGPAAWPSDLCGSLAHDDQVALAAVASARRYCGVGIDVEPPEPLPRELIERVASPAERRRYPPSVLASRLLFCAKEAVYKAQYSCDGMFLDFHDIDLDLDRNRAVTRHGRIVQVVATSEPRMLALAFIAAPGRDDVPLDSNHTASGGERTIAF
jgi:4'-phosphopantetheinyl transferase EntD